MKRRCKPGDLAIVIRSEVGNEGRVVTVERWLPAGSMQYVAPGLTLFINTDGCWLVRADAPLRNPHLDLLGFHQVKFGWFPDSHLLPITPPDKALDEDISSPIDAEVLTS